MIAENLKYLRKRDKLSQQGLADAMSIPRTTLGDYERGKTEPNLAMLVKLSDYFHVEIDALIKQNISHQDYEILRNRNMRILAISVDKDNNENIELVGTRAQAGYLDSFADPEYISDLPKIYFPNIPAGTYRGFEIKGDSMLPIEPGTIIISKYVESLDDIKDDKTYVVVSNQSGLVYKRVKNLPEQQKLTLHSDNEAYPPYDMSYSEVGELWQYYAHVSFNDSKQKVEAQMELKISDIQRKLNELADKFDRP